MKRTDLSDLGLDYFSPVGQDFQDRKNSIKPIRSKVCSKCKQTKPIFKFSIDKRNLDGRTNICKTCRSREVLKYYYHNRIKMLIQNREYLQANKKNRSIYSKIYREKNKEYLKELAKKWYKKNKKRIKKRNLQYYQENKEACQIRRGLWRIKNKEKIKKYNREHKLRRKIAS